MAQRSCLDGGGEAGERLRAIDWSLNPLGPVERWPLSLQAAARIVLSSAFPMMLHWEPELITIYNDAYAQSLGRRYAENAVLGHGHLVPGMQVITKPFAVDALADRVRSMIEAGQGEG